MDFSVYDKILVRSVIGICTICIVVCIVSFIGVIYATRKLVKTDAVICIIGLSFAIIGIVVFSMIKIPQYVYDIKNDAYIIYTGEYSIVSNGRSDILVYIENDSIRLESNAGLDEGQYIGTVIYSERSKIALDIQGQSGDG